jgi:hypothetical protein
LLERAELFLGAVDNPDRLTAPFDRAHFARCEGADIYFNRSTRCAGFFAGRKRADKWNGERRSSCSADGTGRADPEAT